MNKFQIAIVSALVGFGAGMYAEALLVRRISLGSKQESDVAWLAAGIVEERLRKGKYAGLGSTEAITDAVLNDWEFERIRLMTEAGA